MVEIPDPFKNYAMKGAEQPAPQMPAEPIDIAQLDEMSKEELTALIERMARQCGLVASMSEEQTAQAMLDRLAHVALTAQVKDCVGAINAWLDRTQGKPMQRVETKSLVATVDMTEHKKLIEAQAEQMLVRLAGVKTISGG